MSIFKKDEGKASREEAPDLVTPECGCGWTGDPVADAARASDQKNDHIREKHTAPRWPLSGGYSGRL